MKIKETDFPALYSAADKASLRGQKQYLTALRWYLLLLVLVAINSYLLPESGNAAIVSALLFLVSLALLGWMNFSKPQDVWFKSRAVAESVKTCTWKWMTCAEPYSKTLSYDQAKSSFLSDLNSIINQNKSISYALSSIPNETNAISEMMIALRKSEWSERLRLYVEYRVDDQSEWYAKKAIENKKLSCMWFFVSSLLHLAAIALLLLKIKSPEMTLPIEMITTIASAILTWVQSKKHYELNASYSLAAQEIILIKSEASSLKRETEFSHFVINSEAAFSREHTQWIARRIH